MVYSSCVKICKVNKNKPRSIAPEALYTCLGLCETTEAAVSLLLLSCRPVTAFTAVLGCSCTQEDVVLVSKKHDKFTLFFLIIALHDQLVRMAFHQGGLSVSSGWYLFRVVFHQGGNWYLVSVIFIFIRVVYSL